MRAPTRYGQPLLPRVVVIDAKRPPRGCSYSSERDAGRCLIALLFKSRTGERVVVRNCYVRRDGGLVVENAREFCRKRDVMRTIRTGLSLRWLQDNLGMEVLRGPFMVGEPLPNFMVELRPREFELLWTEATATPTKATHAQLYAFNGGTTPTARLIDLHWRQRRVHDGWTPDRLRRLCALWGLAPEELCELIQWSQGHMAALMRGDDAPVPGPVTLWFYFLENVRLGVPVFPNFEPQRKAS